MQPSDQNQAVVAARPDALWPLSGQPFCSSSSPVEVLPIGTTSQGCGTDVAHVHIVRDSWDLVDRAVRESSTIRCQLNM